MYNGIILLWATAFIVWVSVPTDSAFASTKPKQKLLIGYIGGISGNGVGVLSNQSFLVLKELFKEAMTKSELANFDIEVRPYDNGYEPSRNLDLFQKIVQDKVDIITGVHYSNDGLIVAPLAEEAGIPTLITSASHPKIIAGRTFVHRICFSDEAQADVLAKAILHSKPRRLFIIKDTKNSFSIDLAASVANRVLATSNSLPVKTIDVQRGNILSNVFADNEDPLTMMDLVFLTTNAQDSATIIAQINRKKEMPQILGSDAWASLEITSALKLLGLNKIDATYPASIVSSINSKEWKQFQGISKNLGFVASTEMADPITTFEAGLHMISILKTMKTFNRHEFNRLVRSVSSRGIFGPIKINANGESDRSPELIKIKNSKIIGRI